MKLKQVPEDFVVEEISSASASREMNSYKVYLLEKKGLETLSLLRHLAKENKIPIGEFGIAGLKDRHALTRQHFTLPSKYNLSERKDRNFSITFLGYSGRKIELGDLKANRFEIVARCLRKGELNGIQEKAMGISRSGVPNYFDSQRFGSVINNKFIAKFVVKKDYEGAVKAYLTGYTKSEKKSIKDEKRMLCDRWSGIAGIELKTPYIAGIIDEYRKTGSWLAAYKRIPHSIRQMIASAYQSYIWNECVKELLRMHLGGALYSIKYNVGELLFYRKADEAALNEIPKTFKTVAKGISMTKAEGEIIGRLMKREGISLDELDIKKETDSFFKSHEREVIVKPAMLKVSEPEIDEINDKGKKNFFKLRVSFALQPGSYATIITKRLFNK